MNEEEQKRTTDTHDLFILGNKMMELSSRFHNIFQKTLENTSGKNLANQNIDPLNLKPLFTNYWQHSIKNPEKLAQSNIELWQKNLLLWANNWQNFIEGKQPQQHQENELSYQTDKRFKNELWETHPYFNFLKNAYLITNQWVTESIYKQDELDDETKHRLSFFTQQFINALSPSNYLFSNPDAIQKTIETKGLNLIEGLENLIEDLEKGDGVLNLSTTDKAAFEIGKNLATTNGSVVFQNDLMQLIQYAPSTKNVYKTPLLIIPPWINKYYILDMKEENSFVKWLVDQGHTVFMISWVNPNKKHRDKGFDAYLNEGILNALDIIEKATDQKQTNVVGYCIGGTLLTCALAYLENINQAKRIKTATFLTTLVDFKESGDLKLFIDEEQIETLETRMKEKGYLDADYLKTTFSLLRANDLIWSFVVNNYLMGNDPFPFDLLYWNDDSVNLPEKMQSYYLRNMYLENNLIKKNALDILGHKIDITKIQTPSYFLSTREDHIAPWRATFETTKYFSGECTFTLAASGHIAGVINPPNKNKYCYWHNDQHIKDCDLWLKEAKQTEGSWWPHWNKWIIKNDENKTKARTPENIIEPAPGTYVKNK